MEKEGIKQNSKTFILIFLGLLSAFGPFVMDMYLPTLPAMPAFFHTTSSMVQLGLTAGMIGLAVGQLIFGPLSDQYGRRPVLWTALTLFLLATIGCIFSQNILQFIILRLLQGIAGAGGVVLSRSIAADRYTGHELAGMMGLIGAINGIATVVAPIAGGTLTEWSGWQGIFWFLFLLGAGLLAGSLHLNESLPRERRTATGTRDILRNFKHVLHDRQYVGYILQYGFTMGVLFTYIASAPFIMQLHYGLSPLHFSLCFGVNAVAMVAASAAATRFPSMKEALHAGCHGMLLIATLLCVALYGNCSFWIYETLAFALLTVVGLTFTASNALAMDCERENAGVASALLGAIGFIAGGIVSPFIGLGNLMASTGGLFLGGSLLAYLCMQYPQISMTYDCIVRRSMVHKRPSKTSP